MKCSFGCVYLLIAFCLHAEHPDDAQRYFGFPSWKELKVYVRCMWPGVKQDERSVGYCSRTQFEQILISKMFMKTALDQVDLVRPGSNMGLFQESYLQNPVEVVSTMGI